MQRISVPAKLSDMIQPYLWFCLIFAYIYKFRKNIGQLPYSGKNGRRCPVLFHTDGIL